MGAGAKMWGEEWLVCVWRSLKADVPGEKYTRQEVVRDETGTIAYII